MTVAWYDGATLEVSVAFSKGALDTVVDADYTDISADVRDAISINRGRSSETDTFTTGSLQITLDNRTRKYDPEYSAGAFFGNLVPMKHIRVRLTYSASTSYLFHGYVRSWDQQWDQAGTDAVCVVYADDAMKMLGLATLPESIYAVEVLSDFGGNGGWYRLGEANGSLIATDSSGNGRDGFYSQTTPNVLGSGLIELGTNGSRVATFTGELGLLGPSASPYNENAVVIQGNSFAYLVGTDFTWELWVTMPQFAGTGNVQVFSQHDVAWSRYFTVAINCVGGSTSGFWQVVINAKDASGTFQGVYRINAPSTSRHHLCFTRTSATIAFYVDGAVSSPTSSSGGFGVAASDYGTIPALVCAGDVAGITITVDELAMYGTALSAARVLAHYTAGSTAYAGDTVSARITRTLAAAGMSTFPVSLETSTQTVRGCDFGGGTISLLAYLQTLERTEDGRLFVSADGTLTFYTRYHDAGRAVATAFSDVAGGTLPYSALAPRYDDSRIVNDAIVSRTNGTPQRYTDAASKQANGLRSLPVDGLAGQSDPETFDRANAIVYKNKSATLRMEAVTVYPRSAPTTLFPVVRTTEIGARVSARRLPVGVGSAFTKELTVEGVTHHIGVHGDWETAYLTAPGDYSSVWLILDDATFGLLDTGRLGY